MPRAPHRRAGFTLIEMLVVVLIVAIMVGIASVNFMRGPRDLVRDEADRLAVLLQAAQQEAMLQGRVYAFENSETSYRFLKLDAKNRLRPVKDELLRERQMPAGVRIAELRVDGDSGQNGEKTGIVLAPSGELPAFTVVFAAGDARWYVTGTARGEIRSLQSDDAKPL